jgi:glycosyltransferase involved in cell wall biosynthesis
VASAARALARNPRLLYVVVGDGEDRARMEAACRQARVRERFRFVGWVAHGRMPAYVTLADLVVCPSEHEAQSLVCLEAQASGRALLASDIPAAREIVRDGETGLLFPTGDVEQLAARTVALAGDARLRRAIGVQARAAARAHGVARIVTRYAETLAAVLAGTPRPAARRPAPRAPRSRRRPRARHGGTARPR